MEIILQYYETLQKIKNFKNFLGKKVCWLLVFSTMTGFLLFLIETSFVFVLQLFLFALGLLPREQLMLPSWVPVDLNISIYILFIFGLVRGLVYMLKYYLNGIVGQEFIRTQRTRIVEYSFTYANEISTDRVINVFTERVAQGGSFLQHLSQLILVFTSSILFFISGMRIAPVEMMIGVALLAVFLLPLKFLTNKIQIIGIKLRDEWNLVSLTLITGLKNYFFLKLYNLTDEEIDKSKASLDQYRNHYEKYYKISSFKNYFPAIIGIFVVCFITYISLNYIHTKGVLLVSFFYIFIRFSQGMSEASASFSDLTLFKVGFVELLTWFESHKKMRSQAIDKANVSCKNTVSPDSSIEIELKNIDFSYNGKDFLFNDINVVLKKSELLLIKGPSGVGKSTLLQIILGMLAPTKGDVLINGVNIKSYDKLLSHIVGYVGPEPYLIVGSLKENLLFGHFSPRNVTDLDFKNALNFACLDEFLLDLDMKIMEHAALSTGQKQRLAIARALLRKPRILILDEATANLDSLTEEKIIGNLVKIKEELTTIVISHKSTFDDISNIRLELGCTKK